MKPNLKARQKKLGKVTEVEPSILVFPPLEEIKELRHLAMMGNMIKIRKRAIQIEQMDEKFVPFAQKLQLLARGFEEEEILALLELSMEKSQ